ncbi:MAG: hypothetical protein COA39_004400 [Sulfurimonas sp.]|nr:hypothetical protein [Sulfurimonas sp.]
MQRKNNFLRNSVQKSKNGIAMIMAIAVIVIIATIMALSLSLTSQTTKRTTDLYLNEQAILYSKSAVELALLKIANSGCINSLNLTLGSASQIQYDVNITMSYVYTSATTDVAGTLNCDEYFTTYGYITTQEQNGSVLMDIATTLRDSTIATEPIRYFRRTIQKL